MAYYIDGYVLPLQKRKVATYRALARKAAKVFKDCGALDYKEAIGDDLNVPWGLSFPKGIKIKPGETVVFSWIAFKSKKHRDRVNKAAMKHPYFANMDPKDMPFDVKRMLYGGFKTIVG